MKHFIRYNRLTGIIEGRISTVSGAVNPAWDTITSTVLEFAESHQDATHIINNEPVTIIPEPIPPTAEQILATLTQAIQNHLDATARTRNYEGILSLCSYATSTDSIFAAEGQAGVEWRDAVWRTSYTIMAEVQAQTRSIPTTEELLALLPEISWT